ncbi:putative type I restriction enzymeP M protein [Lachnospiraceae bacterium]|nr:putative type I restriction enzymeP M protein [Lachnospiraceae bacterium]
MITFLNDYGYALNKIQHERTFMDGIQKIRFFSVNGAVFLLSYKIENDALLDMPSLYERTKQDGDEFCSLFLISYNGNYQCYSKNLKANQYILLKNMIMYSGKTSGSPLPTAKIESNKFESIFFEAHSFLRDLDGLHPDEALDELCKLIYAKMYDEDSGTNIFSVISGNSEEYSASIRYLYSLANKYDMRVYSLKIPGYKRSRGVFEEPLFISSNAIAKVGQLFSKYNFSTVDIDFKARSFQNVYKPATRAGMGQYFTPIQVIRFIVSCIAPNLSDLIIDPFAGSGHFLTESLSYAVPSAKNEKAKNEFIFYKLHGIEKSERMVRIAMTDMRLHGDGHSNIRCTDSLLPFDSYTDLEEGSFDIVMTNPPFGSILQKESFSYLGDFELVKEKAKVPLEVLGLERSIQLLRDGGKLAIVLPESIFVNKSYAYVRTWLQNNVKIRGIINLPLSTFTPFGANIKTGILIATKNKAAGDYTIFTGVIEDIGFDRKGNDTKSPDWPDIAVEFKKFISKEGW